MAVRPAVKKIRQQEKQLVAAVEQCLGVYELALENFSDISRKVSENSAPSFDELYVRTAVPMSPSASNQFYADLRMSEYEFFLGLDHDDAAAKLGDCRKALQENVKSVVDFCTKIESAKSGIRKSFIQSAGFTKGVDRIRQAAKTVPNASDNDQLYTALRRS